jgi:hypothetical protein
MKQIQKFLSVPGRIVLCLVLFLLAGCGLGDIAAGATSTPQPTCSPSKGVGFYDFPPSPAQGEIAQTITKTIFDGYPDNPPAARREALRFLQAETKRWSHYRDGGENNTRVRMIITFITPELVQALVLNEALSSENPQAKSLDNYMLEGFSNFKRRNEFVFLLTFLPESTQENNPVFYVPPEKIRLHNTSSLNVPRTHSDDFLNGTLKFSDKNQSGFVFFPIGVNQSGKENDCSRVLDPEWDTSLMLEISGAKIGNQTEQTINWTIPFTSLLLPDGTIFKVDWNTEVQPGDDATFKTFELRNLPLPVFGSDPDDIFWRDYGRFIWGKLTSGIVLMP